MSGDKQKKHRLHPRVVLNFIEGRVITDPDEIAASDFVSEHVKRPGAAMNKHTIELDDYEVANLRSALFFLRDIGADTGDWLGQIQNKLSDLGENHPPNKASDRKKG